MWLSRIVGMFTPGQGGGKIRIAQAEIINSSHNHVFAQPHVAVVQNTESEPFKCIRQQLMAGTADVIMVAPHHVNTERSGKLPHCLKEWLVPAARAGINEITRQQNHVGTLLHRGLDPVSNRVPVQERAVMKVAELSRAQRFLQSGQRQRVTGDAIPENVQVGATTGESSEGCQCAEFQQGAPGRVSWRAGRRSEPFRNCVRQHEQAQVVRAAGLGVVT